MSSHPQASAPSWCRQEFAGLDLGEACRKACLPPSHLCRGINGLTLEHPMKTSSVLVPL